MDVSQFLLFAAERDPERVALHSAGRSTSYAELLSRASRFADALRRRGVAPGDRVALGMINSDEFVVTFFGCQLMGAVAVPINFRSKNDGARFMIEHVDARVVVLDDSFDGRALNGGWPYGRGLLWISTGTNPLPDGGVRFEEFLATGDDVLPPGHVDPDALSTILYTSGTTGRPKGVPVSHRATHARVLSLLTSVGPLFDTEMRTIGAAPLYHTVGLHWVLCLTTFLNGSYLPAGSMTVEEMNTTIREQQATFLFGSPTLMQMMLDIAGEEPFDSVTGVCFGSAPMPAPLLEQMTKAFPRASINEVYGTTEISIPFTTRDVTSRPRGALRCTADQRVRVIRPDGGPGEVVEPGVTGELIVDMRNDAMFSGYWNAPEQTAAKIRNGWFHTGDAFHYDDEGNYYITGRLDDMFISGAENIQPAEVEEVLRSHDGVSDVVVLGSPDPTWGQVVVALVVPTGPDLTADELDGFCRASTLDDFKRPRRYAFAEALPRNPSGKLIRAEAMSLWQSLGTDSTDSTDGTGGR